MSDSIPVDDLKPWLQAWHTARHHAAQWAQAAERAKAKITAALDKADAEIGTVDGDPAVRWTSVFQEKMDVSKFRAEYPDIHAAYTHPVVSRRFSVLWKPEGGEQ